MIMVGSDEVIELTDEYLESIGPNSNILDLLGKMWIMDIVFSILNLLISFLPVIEIEYFGKGLKDEFLPINFYLLGEYLCYLSLFESLIKQRSRPILMK